MRLKRSLLLPAFALLVSIALAKDASNDALRGLNVVAIVAEPVGSAVRESGIDEQAIVKAMAEKLRSSGIEVLGRHEPARGNPQLKIKWSLNRIEGPQPEYLYSLDIALVEDVRLIRDPRTRARAATWRTPGIVGIAAKGELGELEKLALAELDKFIAAVRAGAAGSRR